MNLLLVHSLIAYVAAPTFVYACMRVIIRFSTARGPKAWWAGGAAVYAVVSVFLGLAQGAAVGGDVSELFALSNTVGWLAVVVGAGVSLALCFWVITVMYARLRAVLGLDEALH
jgi:hypothetical protein